MFFYIFHAKVVVLLEASVNFKVRLADEISSRAFFLRTSTAECKQKCAGAFLLSAVFFKMLKNLCFLEDSQVFFLNDCVFCYN